MLGTLRGSLTHEKIPPERENKSNRDHFPRFDREENNGGLHGRLQKRGYRQLGRP